MIMTNDMINNLSFDKNESVERANQALKIILQKEEFWFCIRGYTAGYDTDTGEVLYFFVNADLQKLTPYTKEKFLADVRKNWKDHGFEIVDEKELAGDVYFHVGFRSMHFRLKDTKTNYNR